MGSKTISHTWRVGELLVSHAVLAQLCTAWYIPDERQILSLLSCLTLHTHRISIFLELLDYTLYENTCSEMCVTHLIFSSHIINAVSKDMQAPDLT